MLITIINFDEVIGKYRFHVCQLDSIFMIPVKIINPLILDFYAITILQVIGIRKTISVGIAVVQIIIKA